MDASSLNETMDISDMKKVDSSTFFHALERAKGKNPYGAFVTLHEKKDYDACKGIFLLYDESAGVAVQENGNIISVFSDGTHRGIVNVLLEKAIEIGGDRLDCFASEVLKSKYLFCGFIPVSCTKFEDRFAPPDWNYGRDGRPDIYFWRYDGTTGTPSAPKARKESGYPIQEFSSYDAAMEYRDSVMK